MKASQCTSILMKREIRPQATSSVWGILLDMGFLSNRYSTAELVNLVASLMILECYPISVTLRNRNAVSDVTNFSL